MNRIPLPFGTPNPIQEKALQAFRDGKRIVLLISGRQAGKSHLGARWLLAQTMNPHAKNKLAFAVAPTYRMARVLQRKLEEVLKADPRLWRRIRHTKQPIPTYELPNGWIIEVHSSDDPDALRGPTVDVVWYDEIAKGSEESFDILMPTLLASGGSFLGTTTPRGKQNWVHRKIALKAYPPGHPEHDEDAYNPIYAIITGSTWDNVDNLSEEAVLALEDQYGKDSAFGRQEISGEFVSYEGLVYAWDEINFIPHKKVPELEEFSWIVGGIDFGWTDPSALVVLGYKDGVWYVLDCFYESKVPFNDLAEQVASLGQRYKVETWYADSAEPERILDLSSRGLPVQPVKKPLIEDRIREMAIFADNNRFKVSYRAPAVRDELQTYQYPDEEKLLRDKRRNPIDRNNHSLDAIGYVIWSMRWLWRNEVSYDLNGEVIPPDDPNDEEVLVLPKRHGGVYGPSGLAGS